MSAVIKKMKILETIQKYLVLLGINPNETNPFNWKITMGFLLIGLAILSNFILIFSIDNITSMDFVNFFNLISSLMLMCISLATIVSQQTKLFEFIGSLEKLTNESNQKISVWFNEL